MKGVARDTLRMEAKGVCHWSYASIMQNVPSKEGWVGPDIQSGHASILSQLRQEVVERWLGVITR